jgi:hypothetical protein
MNNYYVYEHWRTDRDECFYVGKGKGIRAYKMSCRNRHHAAIQAKVAREGFAIEVKIVASGLSENEAFNLEMRRIAFWRDQGVDLANISSGGDGPSGVPAWNKRKVICLDDGNVFDSSDEAVKYYNIDRSCLSACCNGKGVNAGGKHFAFFTKKMTETERKGAISKIYELAAARRKKSEIVQAFNSCSDGVDAKGRRALGPMKNRKPVICIDDDVVFPSASDAARKYNIPVSGIIELCLGKRGRKTIGGKKFKYVESEG